MELLGRTAEQLAPGLVKHTIQLEKCFGALSVYVQGDLESKRDGPAILTIHDIGQTYMSMVDFVSHTDMADIKSRALIVHVALFGQDPSSDPDLQQDFPALDDVGNGLISVLDELKIPQVVVLGDGAGAYIALRFGMSHADRIIGMIVLNCSAAAGPGSSWFAGKEGVKIAEGSRLSVKNVAKFEEAYNNRPSLLQDLADKIKFDLLVFVGGNSRYVEDAYAINASLKRGICSVIKVEDLENPLKEAAERVADSTILFCQGLGLMATAKRRFSKQLSNTPSGQNTPARKMSMADFDTPNLRRLSLNHGETEDIRRILQERRPSLFKRSLSQDDYTNIHRYIVQLEGCGPISVYVQGDLEKYRGDDQAVFLTVHDVGTSYLSMVDFFSNQELAEIRSRSLFLHVSVFGQSPGAEDLAIPFPSLEDIALGLVTVLDLMKISKVICLGDGAGANICLRFGILHPTRVHGLVLVNASAASGTQSFFEKLVGLKVEAKEELNQNNVVQYEESFRKREELVSRLYERIGYDVICMSGTRSKYLDDVDQILSNIKPGLCSVIKVDDSEDPLLDAVEKVADSLILFCQGLNFMPTARRKWSLTGSGNNSGSNTPSRKMSMDQFDIPNLRRLSLTTP